MKNLTLKIVLILIMGIHSLKAQIKVESDSIKIINNNCATKLARDFMFTMEKIEGIDSQQMPLRSIELLKGTEFEKEKNGIFIVSTLSSNKRKLILLKRENRIKILTLNDVSKSLIELISFLNSINSSNEELFSYLNLIEEYIKDSKNAIKASTKVKYNDWIKCDSLSN